MPASHALSQSYLVEAEAVIRRIADTQAGAIERAADAVAHSLKSGGLLYLFGTGHSASVAVEPYHRAGSLVPIRPIVEPAMTLHSQPAKATALERLDGYARIIIDDSGMKRGDTLIVISNSGINAVPVEMALGCRKLGIIVIAITSVRHSATQSSRHASGKRLFEAADIVIDNCGGPGDAAVETSACPVKIGPTSTLAGIAIVNAISAGVVGRLHEMGIEPPVMVSSNMAGGDAHGAQWQEAFAHPGAARSLVGPGGR